MHQRERLRLENCHRRKHGGQICKLLYTLRSVHIPSRRDGEVAELQRRGLGDGPHGGVRQRRGPIPLQRASGDHQHGWRPSATISAREDISCMCTYNILTCPVSTMVVGMLALMVHLWVCSMRFFLYYLDTLIRDSPSVLLEMTTVGLLGGQTELMPLGPLTRFLRHQQPQIHITVCWFLSLCYADYIRKHYCRRFNVPYLEQWQSELQARTARGVNRTIENVQSFVASVQQRLRGYETHPPPNDIVAPTESMQSKRAASSMDLRAMVDQLTSQSRVDGCGRASDSVLICKKSYTTRPNYHFQTRDSTTEAIEKLRNFINATRCSCNPKNADLLPVVQDAIIQDVQSG